MDLFRTGAALLLLITFGAQAQSTASHPANSRTSATASSARTAATGDLIDINHATAAVLRTLPGIGDAYSAAIVRRRPYKNKTQLRSKGVIPLAAYRKIKDQIIARQ